jgi:hypothetical protein
MITPVRDMPDLEIAMLRRSVDDLARDCDRCSCCHRSPLIGERVYVYASGTTVCELCRTVEGAEPASSRLVHGPAFGHTLRIIDRRTRRARVV